jgi:hypothetical protein
MAKNKIRIVGRLCQTPNHVSAVTDARYSFSICAKQI